MALSSRTITLEALALLNEVGLSRVSTRSLASRLGVQGPALYRHFRSKDKLLDSMGAQILHEGFSGLDSEGSPHEWLTGLAHQSRAAMLGYRDGARLLALSSPSGTKRTSLAKDVTEPLIAKGLNYRMARQAIIVVSSLAEGWVLNEQNPATRLIMERDLGDIDAAYRESVESIVNGLLRAFGANAPS